VSNFIKTKTVFESLCKFKFDNAIGFTAKSNTKLKHFSSISTVSLINAVRDGDATVCLRKFFGAKLIRFGQI